MMVLRLGNKGLYCVIKLHEIEKVALNNLGFLVSSLVSFLMAIPCNPWQLNSFDILHYAFQISHQNRKSF